ncbi:heteromeric transposase endonuclease subunit TnsA [Bacillus sp. B-jedd]|uniref:heteromeric transposase endonuclease subunit TnsA n=1 Tax=Bacillus sp. B-jedd TaxID=1476857 RepID=UPI0005156290|nr:heteromeric transposase endonuclease subunit TnsA [Bacillus sp. B-jedd]CEG25316.1 Tn7-like transposition protein A [Bacillus sp. B-jedd]
MPKRKRGMNEQKYNRWIKEGRGQGEGKEYKPWLTIHDVPSSGVVSREKSWTVGRIHHLLSRLELNYFYVLDWADAVVDIREQYPLLPLDRTIEIAEDLGIPHPRDPETKEYMQITTDFYLKLKNGTKESFCARTVKPSNKITKRTVEKFAIEKKYYDEQDVDWKIVTDKNLPKGLIHNIEWIHNAVHLEFAPNDLEESMIYELAEPLFYEIISTDRPLARITQEFDRKVGLSIGCGIFIVQHMLATKQWKTDMFTKINPSQPIQLEMKKALV